MTTTKPQNDLEEARRFFAAKVAFTTGVAELATMIENGDDITIVDVRAPRDYEQGHVPGALNLPRLKWATAKGLSKDKPNVIYCYSQTCRLAAKAALEFAGRGYPVVEMEGGFATWQASDKPVERGVAAGA